MNFARVSLLHIPSAAVMLAMVSCASMKEAGRGSMDVVKSTTKATADGFGSLVSKAKMPDLATVIPGGRKVKVVDVREADLKEMPTGHERALAFDRERKRSFWVFGGPVDFKEPELPETGATMDGSLLPPLPN